MRMHTPRRGFTLVELLVAAALTMLIMAILASTFQTAMDGMSHLRAAAELQDRLRSASERLRSDLASPHFEDEAIARGQLSNLRFDLPNILAPAGGYFNVVQAAPSTLENRLGVLSPSDYSSTSTNHALVFTAKLSGKTTQNLFTAPRPAGTLDQTNDNLVSSPAATYASKWAVVSWFLSASDTTTGPNPRTMYTLHRRVKLLAETADSRITIPTGLTQQQFDNWVKEMRKYYAFDDRKQIQILNNTPSSTVPPTYTTPPIYIYDVNNPNFGRVLTVKDSAIRGINLDNINGFPRELPPLNIRTSSDLTLPNDDGSDIVVSNVLSFEVKADYSRVDVGNPVTSAIAANISLNTPAVPQNPQNPFLPAGIGFPTMYPRPASPILPLPPTAGATHFNPFANPDFPYDDLPRQYLPSIVSSLPPGTLPAATNLLSSFDTGANPGYRIKALQIKLRVYDPKTQTSRQVTIIQEM